MEKRNATTAKRYSTYELSRRNPATWFAVLFAVLSAAFRIVHYSLLGENAEGVGSTWYVFFLIVLPVIVCIYLVYALLRHGERRLYKTLLPVYLGMIFFIARNCALMDPVRHPACYELEASGLGLAISIIVSVLFAILYKFTVNPGGLRSRLYALILGALILAQCVCHYVIRQYSPDGDIFYDFAEFSAFSMILSIEIVLIFMKKVYSDEPFPMAGDRPDGRRLRSLDPITGVGVYIMPDRNGADNLFRDSFECSNAEKYIRKKREEGLENFGYTHLILAAYVRVVSQRPGVNRFISGQKIYSRGKDIEVSMAIKKEMATDGSETIINVHFSPDDTADDVYRKFNLKVEEVKATSELDSSFDKVAGLLNLIPGLFMKFTVWLLKTMDYFGLIPKFLLQVSPFHGSIFITSMGSLGVPPVYHHLYDFGNIPVFVAFGIKRRQCEMQNDGSIVQHKYIDFSVVTDERICDGFYFASAFKLMKRYLANPDRLDEKPESVVDDVY